MKIYKHDIIAPASLLTATGLFFVFAGSLMLNRTLGLQLVVLGRFMDLLDGPAARATRTSRFGAAFDASADKASLVAILLAAFHYHLAPLAVLFYIVVHNLLNAVVTIVAERREHKPYTSVSGKLSMFFENMSLFSYFIAALYHHQGWRIVGTILLLISLPLGIRATYKYFRNAHA